MKYIDIHAHTNFKAFDKDRDDVMVRAQEKEMGMIIVGTNLENTKLAIEMAEKYPNTWVSIGIHPIHTDEKFSEQQFERLAQHEKVVAIGETGLDYFGKNIESKEAQLKLFDDHIQLAQKYKKAVMTHIRSSKKSNDAHKDVMEIIKGWKKKDAYPHFHLHCYVGGSKLAKEFLELGCTFSFTGIITFARDYDKTIRFLPMESILSETDSPLLSPVPYREERNEPIYVVEVVKKIAEIKNLSEEETAENILQNAKRIFNLKY